jgi:hypothetical protein
MSCAELALAGGFLARHGVRLDGSRLLSRSDAKRINAVMLTCGTYDAAGEFAYRVGLPAKSGVAGGILAIIPGRCGLCVWSPGLDDKCCGGPRVTSRDNSWSSNSANVACKPPTFLRQPTLTSLRRGCAWSPDAAQRQIRATFRCMNTTHRYAGGWPPGVIDNGPAG